MKKIYSFTSVLEESSLELSNVAGSFLEGMRITDIDGKNFIVGNLALSEGTAPHKFINSSARDLDYRILSLVSLVLATQGQYFKFHLTTGFPFTTYQSFKKDAIDFLKRRHQIAIDTKTFGGQSIETVNVNVEQVNIMTEIDGCIKTIRDGNIREKDNFFIVSLGFGTFEAALSTPNGIVNRTTVSSKGLSYAVNILEKELQKDHYLKLLTEKQIERAFQRGVIIVDRQKIDLKKQRAKALEIYYNEVISPELRKKFSDDDFLDTSKIYLAGGGAFYSELVELFKKEFQNILDVIVPPDPNLCAGIGYCIHSIEEAKKAGLTDKKSDVAYVGIDLGNSNTVVVIDADGIALDQAEKSEAVTGETDEARIDGAVNGNDLKTDEINIQQN
ncbi:MAG: hypothetical protein AB2L20_06890 [Mangrovibacterium sp.]